MQVVVRFLQADEAPLKTKLACISKLEVNDNVV